MPLSFPTLAKNRKLRRDAGRRDAADRLIDTLVANADRRGRNLDRSRSDSRGLAPRLNHKVQCRPEFARLRASFSTSGWKLRPGRRPAPRRQSSVGVTLPA